MRGREGTCLPYSPEYKAPLGKRATLWHVGNAPALEQEASFWGRQGLSQALTLGLPYIEKERKGSTMEDNNPN